VEKERLERRQTAVYAVGVAAAVAVSVALPDLSTRLEPAINPVLALLLYVTFLEVPFVRMRRAFRNTRFMAAALGVNFVVVPVVVGVLTVPISDTLVLVGALMVLLTPCIDYVITFTEVAGGDSEQITATTPALMLAQLALLPLYLWLFVGEGVAEVVEPAPFVEAFVLIIALPLVAAWLTQAASERSATAERWGDAVGWLPVPMMSLTLFVVIASQIPRVQESVARVAPVVPVYVGFLLVMPPVARTVASLLGMGVGESRALVFTSTTRNSLVVLPLALSLPSGYGVAPRSS
jgi:ACR3 family arsenite efflux pump ArsB